MANPLGLLLDKQLMILEIKLQLYESRSEMVHLCSAKVILGTFMDMTVKVGTVKHNQGFCNFLILLQLLCL